jgi:sensor histidine kinase regulating citrate/malate metabolism
MGVSFYTFENQWLSTHLQEAQSQTAQALARVAREAILAHDDTLVLNYIKLIERSQTCAYAFVADARGKVLFHADPTKIGQDAKELASEKNKETSDVTSVVSSIQLGNQPLGAAYVGFSDKVSKQVIHQALRESLKKIVIASSLGLAVGFIGSFVVSMLVF